MFIDIAMHVKGCTCRYFLPYTIHSCHHGYSMYMYIIKIVHTPDPFAIRAHKFQTLKPVEWTMVQE